MMYTEIAELQDYSKPWDSLMHYLGPDTLVKTSTGGTWTSDNSRSIVCGTNSSWSVHPSDTSVGSVDCNEYAMASTHESGGYPPGLHHAVPHTPNAAFAS
ncbi:hypothetical protein [Streptomyces sp. NPDC047070]|uniref:hypothetical protein n=1 Tax=Streptomyces sp. NPDC047070 TaxID=3154923 RepID=UPI0034523E11